VTVGMQVDNKHTYILGTK